MEEKFSDSTGQRPNGERMINATLVRIDLPFYISQIKEETSWKTGNRNAITVFKTNGLRIVFIALHEGSEMATHTAEGIISVQVLEGLIQFNTESQSVELGKGQMLALHERVPHSVKALRESVFLLTLTSSLALKLDQL